MLFDTLDGRVARMTRTESAFGKEYDSLADMVSFGVAPAIVAYQWGVARLFEYGAVWGRVGWLAAFLYAVCAALRLARFNTRRHAGQALLRGPAQPVGRGHRLGLHLVLQRMARAGPARTDRRLAGHGLGRRADGQQLRLQQLQAARTWKARCASPPFLLVPLGFVLIALYPPPGLMVIFGGYALSGPLLWLWSAARSRGRRRVTPRGRAGIRVSAARGVPGGAGAGGLARSASHWLRKPQLPLPGVTRRRSAGRLRERIPGTPLEAKWLAALRCALHETRTSTVFGVGDRQADWLVVGEAPGAEEDRQGEPFVGRAGGLLNSMLRGIGLAREQVFIANVLKCRPPDNRDPRPEEVAQCLPYLERQIALLQPTHHAGRGPHRRAEPAGHRHAHRQAARPVSTASALRAFRWW